MNKGIRLDPPGGEEYIPFKFTREKNNKRYELSNHLGNVLAVVSDQKEGIPSVATNWFADYYDAKVVSANDYYPFGMAMPGRTSNSPEYRYGFNGKEKDESGEWGDLTHYDYGFRIYNAGIGRFLSVDPLIKTYPMLTPYQFASNTPIQAIDLDGLEAEWYGVVMRQAKAELEVAHGEDVANEFEKGYQFASAAVPVFAIEIFFTKGKLTQYISSFLAFSTLSQLHYIDNLSSEEQSKLVEEVKKEIAFELLGYGIGKAFEVGSGVAISLSKSGDEFAALDDLTEVVVTSSKKSSNRARAVELAKSLEDLPPQVSKRVTIGVAQTADGKTLIGINTSHADKRVVDRIRANLGPDEILVPDALGTAGHAELNIVNYAKRNNQKITNLDTNTYICEGCDDLLERNNISTDTPRQKSKGNSGDQLNLFDGG